MVAAVPATPAGNSDAEDVKTSGESSQAYATYDLDYEDAAIEAFGDDSHSVPPVPEHGLIYNFERRAEHKYHEARCKSGCGWTFKATSVTHYTV